MAAAVGVEARWQTPRREHLPARPKRRHRALFLDQEGRVELVGGIVHRHDEVERRRSRKPFRPAAILVQHHAHARLPRPLAPVRTAPLRSLDQAGRVQLRLGPGVAPAKPVPLLKMLVKMLDVPAAIFGPVLVEHPFDLVDRHPLGRGLAQALVQQPGGPFFLVALPVAPKLPLRHPQNLPRVHCRQLPPLPTAQNVPELLHSPVL